MSMHSTKRSALLGALALSLVSGHAGAFDLQNGVISEQEVLGAQKAWGDAVVAISRDHETGGIAAAKAKAEAALDGAYGYQLGLVLFKPTLTKQPHTFRTTREGALSYFVGGNPKFPEDTGFALKGWRKVEIRNVAIQLHGQTATTLGNVMFTDKDGKVTTVDKSWTFRKDDRGVVRIVQHHSSLPFTGN